MAPICKFWQKGFCKNGDQCRYDHSRGGGGGGQAVSNNRYAVLNSDSPGHGGSRGSSSIRHEHPYHLDREIIKTDLSAEKPIWILSAYGPGRGAPLQLFGGYPREQSFEELRLRYYELASSGNEPQAIQEEQQLIANAEQQIQTALKDINGAIKYIVSGEKEHPNRIDICEGRGPAPSQAPAASTNPPVPNAFGQAPSFGQPSAPAPPTTAFGQRSAFGSQATPFGQPSQLGNAPSAFSTSTPSFGQQPAFGAQPTPVFGQSAPLGAQPTPAFGQPAPMGAQPTPAFGQPASSAPAFGQPSIPTGFGRAASPFAKAQAPAFGQPTPPSGFGNQSVPAFGSGGGGGGGLGNAPAPAPAPTPSNPFGQPSTAPSNPSPFTQPQPTPTPTPSLFTPPTSTTPPPSSDPTHKTASGRLTQWHGRAITYVDNEPCFRRADGRWEKVWFPDGAPAWSRPVDVPDGWWTDDVAERYRYARERGEWMDGWVPEVMPKREWVSWDF
ncbi:hypothetical protein MMC26_002158 [Xylographa opegraphella]|nr:hypothetical protein [Xylographa opegraphella]